MPIIKYSLLAVAALFAYLLFLRPLMRTLRGASEQTQPMKTVEELEAELRSESDRPLLGGPGDPLAQIRQEVLGGDMLRGTGRQKLVAARAGRILSEV